MRHQKRGRKFGLKRGKRKSFLRILAGNLIQRGRIVTTEARAKEIRPLVESLVTHGKKQNVAALRLLMSRLPRDAAYKIYHDIAPRYRDRKGGYIRIIKRAKLRQHDASHMATIEFV